MKNVPYRFLQTSVEAVQKLLNEEGVLTITSKGKAFAIMIDLQGESLEDAKYLASQIRAGMAVAALREEAKEKGLDGSSMEEITEETRIARGDRGEGSQNSQA